MTSSELSEHMTENDARLITGYIRNLIASVTEKIDEIGKMLTKAYDRRAWVALGYESWDAYVSAELRTDRLRLDRDDRQDLVVQLRSAGMATRAIGSALGVDKGTVRNDLRDAPGGESSPPVTGRDGKRYPPTQPPRGCSTCGGTQDHLPNCALIPQTPRAQDVDLPDEAQPVARPVEDPASPAPSVKPNEAVTEYLNGSQSVQDAKYLHAFATAMARSDDFLRFDAERIGRLCDNDDLTSVEQLLDSTERFLSAMRRARSGLRVVNGGKS